MPDVLITGAAGFTGSILASRLRAGDPAMRIVGVGRTQPNLPGPFTQFFVADLAGEKAVAEILESARPHWIFHLAGKLKGTATELFQANLQNTVQLLEAAARVVPTARVLLVGSAAEYGFSPELDGVPIPETRPCLPFGPYGISKFAATIAGLDFGRRTELRVNVARTFNLIGPGIPPTLLLGALIQRVKEAVKTGAETITVGNLSAERDFIDVRDAADAYATIMRSDAAGEVFNVCTGVATPIAALVENALAHSPVPLRWRVDPALVRADDPKCVIGCGAKLASLGFTPQISVSQSLRDSCAGLVPLAA